ncbi:myosin-10 isoform X1 [Selaginella moellendorffii]|uniref:myosin-10 isoform X1 n=1 Tax=Selaginella moellendorffii TaxID=88036 RepID=UPI000D1CA261|nr:myosin-10 isoform X1 [Selaginella moellendorffii]|eukprot:XP_024528231.1 myosin-10 isoform X1 [Selaginella moellendorffii]
MRRIFPSILSPASSGESPSPLKDVSSQSTLTQDKECVTAPAARQKSPARSRSPFKWGRSTTPRGEETRAVSRREHTLPKEGKMWDATPPSKEEKAALAAARRLAHPGRSIEMDLASPASRSGPYCEDDCEEKQVLSVRACSPTAYFQSAHRMRALTDETRSTAESRYRPSMDTVLQPPPGLGKERQHAKRTKSAPRLRMPFSGDSKAKSSQHRFEDGNPSAEGPFAMLSSFVSHLSPGRTRGHGRTDSAENLSVATSGSNSFGERRAIVEYDEAIVPYKFRRDNDKAPGKAKGARLVAEKLAKAIRGTGGSKKDLRAPASFSEGSSGVANSSPYKDSNSTRALKSYLNESSAAEVDPNEIILDFSDNRYLSYGSFRNSRSREMFPLGRREALKTDSELMNLDNKLKEYEDQVDNMHYVAQERASEAEKQVQAVKAELADSYLSDDSDFDGVQETPDVQSRARELLEQKLRLALEAASEAKQRLLEQVTIKDGLALMKRRLELAAVTSEREKSDQQTSLEEELQRREADWIARLEKAQMEETRLKGRVRDIAENNVSLQKETASMAAREKGLREQIRQYEDQIATHKKKLDEAEKVILEIRESSVNTRKQSMHTEDELASLRKSCQEKEDENTDLRRLVARLQQLCTDHEKSIQGLYNGLNNVTDSRPQEKDKAVVRLQNELVRLSTIEQGLRRELDASNREATAVRRELKKLVDKAKVEERDGSNGTVKPGFEYHSEVDRLKTQIYELQEHNSILTIKLSTALREEKTKTDSIREMESRKKNVDEEVKSLQDEIAKRKLQLQDKDKDFKWLETRLQAVVKTNRLLQGIVAKQAAFRKRVSEDGNEDTECDVQKCLEVSAEQLNQMSERLELMKDKLLERESELFAARTECGKKDVTIQGLEQNMSEARKTLETRIQRLTGRNEELFRLYNAKEKEIVDLQTRLKQESELRQKSETELEQMKEQSNDLKEELKVQDMHCVLLREKLCAREVELEHHDVETKRTVEDRFVLKKDAVKLQALVDEAAQRVISLEHKLAEKEEKITWLQRGLNDRVQDWSKVKEELVRTRKERDSIKSEAEQLGREALRMSAEVEVLKRRVHLLEEDILMKEGELSILQGNMED